MQSSPSHSVNTLTYCPLEVSVCVFVHFHTPYKDLHCQMSCGTFVWRLFCSDLHSCGKSQLILLTGVANSPGQTLRGGPSHLPKQTTPANYPAPLLEDTDGDSLPADHERCVTCGSVMPSLRLVMHQRHCANRSFICPHCK